MLLQGSKGVQRIGHIALRVENLDRAKSFYLNLGMQLIWDDKDWCYLEAGKGKDGLALLGPSYKAAGPHFAFHFEDKKEVKNIYTDTPDNFLVVKNKGLQLPEHLLQNLTLSYVMR